VGGWGEQHRERSEKVWALCVDTGLVIRIGKGQEEMGIRSVNIYFDRSSLKGR
jgi:hypothetical protein